MKTVKKLWGSEKWIVNDQKYCVKFLVLKPNKTSSLHYHKEKRETFLGIQGKMILETEGSITVFEYGQATTILPDIKHRFFNPFSEECWFYECSTLHSERDVVRLTKSGTL